MTDHQAITKGRELMFRFRPSRIETTIRQLEKLSRSRGIETGTREHLRQASVLVRNGVPIAALLILDLVNRK